MGAARPIKTCEVSEMNKHSQGRVEDYTGVCLVMALVNLMWIMVVIWAWQGFIAALLLLAAVYQSISWLDMRRAKARSR